MHLPVRFQLHGSPDPEVIRRISSITEARLRGVPLADLPELIDSANELVLWQLALRLQEHAAIPASKGVFPTEPSRWKPIAARLLSRALSDADAEGVVWTPVLDALAGSPLSGKLLEEESANGELPLPSLDERAALLRPWLERLDEPAAFAPLLEFQAEVIHLLVIEHSPAITPELASRLRLTPRVLQQLLTRHALDAPVSAILVERAYANWRRFIDANPEAENRAWALMPDAEILKMLMATGLSYPQHIRDELIALATRPPLRSIGDAAVEALMFDPTIPAELMDQLPAALGPRGIGAIISHPNCPAHYFDAVLSQPSALFDVVYIVPLPRDVLRRIYEQCGDYDNIQIGLLKQAETDPSIWLEIIARAKGTDRSMMLTSLSYNPVARQHPQIRVEMRKSSSHEVILNLLSDRRPEEFESLLLKLLRVKPQRAIKYLEKEPIPPKTPFPRKLFARLLGSHDQKQRLLGITLLPRFQDEQAIRVLNRLEPPETPKSSKPTIAR